MSLVKANTYQDASGGSNAVFSGVASPPNSMGNRNRIINGNMVIDQRNAGAATANTISGYTLDRWAVSQSTTGKLIAQQNAGSVTPPAGFTNYLGVTSQSAYSVAAGDYYMIYQMIEGYNVSDFGLGAAGAATFTISFWVRSSLTGTFGGSLQNNANNRSYPFTYTISAANTWEQKTVTVVGDTTGTWEKTTNTGLRLNFGLGVGSTYSGTAGSWAGSNFISATGATSVVGTNGATFYITGVQLEAGSVASPFERRDYGRELMMCQRYCYQVTSVGGTDGFVRYAVGECVNTAVLDCVIPFPVQMRVTPSLTTPAASQFAATASPIAGTSIALLAGSGVNTGGVRLTVASGLTTGRAAQLMSNNNNTSYLLFPAEL
jgi:hypothetical protein